jgi:hypothetical protein
LLIIGANSATATSVAEQTASPIEGKIAVRPVRAMLRPPNS